MRVCLCFLAIAFGLSWGAEVTAAELRILTPRALWTVLNEVGPEFERGSGHTLTVVTDLAPTLAERISRGEAFDVFVGPPAQVERLIQSGRLVAATRTPLARSGIGVEVR